MITPITSITPTAQSPAPDSAGDRRAVETPSAYGSGAGRADLPAQPARAAGGAGAFVPSASAAAEAAVRAGIDATAEARGASAGRTAPAADAPADEADRDAVAYREGETAGAAGAAYRDVGDVPSAGGTPEPSAALAARIEAEEAAETAAQRTLIEGAAAGRYGHSAAAARAYATVQGL